MRVDEVTRDRLFSKNRVSNLSIKRARAGGVHFPAPMAYASSLTSKAGDGTLPNLNLRATGDRQISQRLTGSRMVFPHLSSLNQAIITCVYASLASFPSGSTRRAFPRLLCVLQCFDTRLIFIFIFRTGTLTILIPVSR
jgi:hypothetical protein